MGIYYAAVDRERKVIIHPPGDYACKFPGIIHPNNIFPQMVFMENSYGANFKVINDCDHGDFYEDWKDETQEVYEKYKAKFPEHKFKE